MIYAVEKELINIDPLRFIVEIAPVPKEEKGGCLGAIFLLIIWIFALWVLWQLLKWLARILVTYVLPFLLVAGLIIGSIFLIKYLWNMYQG